jgi:predicted dehydrogenase
LTAVGVHSLDHMIEFGGRVRDVRCVTARHVPGHSDDTTTVMLHFESGATGLIFCSVATATNFAFTLYGSRGLAEISKPNLQTFRFVPTSEHAPTGPVTAPPDQISEHTGFNMLGAELTAFARSIRDKNPYPVPIEDVLHGMSVFDAIVRAGKSGRIEPVTG